MIRINNVKLTSPTSYKPSIMDITNGERNSKGTMFLDHIATKWKLELSWNALTQEQMTSLLNALEGNVTFSVSFLDLYGHTQTRTFYKGDRKAGLMIIKNNKCIWQDFSVNLIEV